MTANHTFATTIVLFLKNKIKILKSNNSIFEK